MDHFQYHLSSLNNTKYGYITLGSEEVYRFDNVDGFFGELGYTEESRGEGITGDEFIRLKYLKGDENQNLVCLQIALIKYLNKHSEKFKENYAARYIHWLSECGHRMMSNAIECRECIKHQLGDDSTGIIY